MLHKYRGRVTLEDLATGRFRRREYSEYNPAAEEMMNFIVRVCRVSEFVFPFSRPQSPAAVLARRGRS